MRAMFGTILLVASHTKGQCFVETHRWLRTAGMLVCRFLPRGMREGTSKTGGPSSLFMSKILFRHIFKEQRLIQVLYDIFYVFRPY
jgi:hypothetical protein